MARSYQVISGDGHLETPPDGWLKHVPAKYRDRAPRLVKLAEGGEGWLVEGLPLIHNGQNLAAGRTVKVRGESYWNPDGSPAPGTGDGVQRLREQDQDGIDAEVLYPPVFISKFIEAISDRQAYLAMIRAYNDFVAEYCSVAPDRLIGNGVIPVTGCDDALAELARCKEIGLKTIAMGQFPNGSGTPKPEDDRFWERALELELGITAHGSLGGKERLHPLLIASATGAFDLVTAMVSRTIPGPIPMIAQTVASGLFDRIPELEIYLAETNAGWMPEAFYMMDDSYALFKSWYGVELKMRPSEYARRHFYFGIVRDPVALELREALPADRLLWGSDFPHSVTSYPKSQHWLGVIFDGVPDELRRRILLDNPCRVFHLDRDAAITETPR
jgi:predicted TIM-barrel fold metal-dependent hydrolase